MYACLTHLRRMRSDERFLELWQEAESKIAEYDLREMALSRHIQPPKHYSSNGQWLINSSLLWTVSKSNILLSLIT